MLKRNNLYSIAKHVEILNKELGKVQIDIAELKTNIKWTFRVIGYIAVLLTGIVIKSLF